jgi:hypothetical protein
MKRRDKGKKQRGVGVEDHPDHEKEEEIAENSTKEEWKGRKSERAEQNIRGMWGWRVVWRTDAKFCAGRLEQNVVRRGLTGAKFCFTSFVAVGKCWRGALGS